MIGDPQAWVPGSDLSYIVVGSTLHRLVSWLSLSRFRVESHPRERSSRRCPAIHGQEVVLVGVTRQSGATQIVSWQNKVSLDANAHLQTLSTGDDMCGSVGSGKSISLDRSIVCFKDLARLAENGSTLVQPRRRVVGPRFVAAPLETADDAPRGTSLRLPFAFADGAFQ
jgi:hypothetical protein